MTYLDYAATTPLDPIVLEAMQPYFAGLFGNPSSVHRLGQVAESAVETARSSVAAVLNCDPGEIIFTSCGTESDNLAIRGAALSARRKSGASRLLAAKAEHHAVLRTCEQLSDYNGFTVDWLVPDETGRVDPASVDAKLHDGVAIVSVMYANNEIGTINPIAEIAESCHRHGVLIHTDAVQAAAYLPLDVKKLNVDLLSLGGHKFHGPKGVGALFVRRGTPLIPSQTGGGQEFGLRAGTSNVPLIVGFSKALQLAQGDRASRASHARSLRDQIIGAVLEHVPESRLSGHPTDRLPNHASFVFRGVDGNLLLTLLDAAGFACSSGSACKTGDPEPSDVLISIGITPEWALGSLRVTVGKDTTLAEVDAFLRALPPLVEKARRLRSIPV